MRTPRKIKLKLSKPRNPLVAPASQRKAGSHERNAKQERQLLKQALRREREQLH
jgi:hypothetical protein